jgi:hypothetical protein
MAPGCGSSTGPRSPSHNRPARPPPDTRRRPGHDLRPRARPRRPAPRSQTGHPDTDGNTGPRITNSPIPCDHGPAGRDRRGTGRAYQERWEFESSLDEIKTHQRGRGGVLRSKSSEMIKQEIWAFLLTHYTIRRLMCEAADQAGKDPDRLSFMRSLRVIRRQVIDQAALSPLPAVKCPDRHFRGNP